MRKTFTIGSMLLLGFMGINSAQAQFVQSNKVISDAREDRAEFGTSVDINGEYAVVGASRETFASGAAYIYMSDEGGNWNFAQRLAANDANEGAEFGGAAKFADDHLVVAAGRADVDGIIRAGALYIYENQDGTWATIDKLTASDMSGDAKLGMNPSSLDTEGNQIIAGAPGENTWSGAVYVFEHDGDEWSEVQKISNPNMNPAESFGIGVAVDGHYLAIGASEVDNRKGAVYIYKLGLSGGYELIQEVVASDANEDAFFGSYVDILNGELVVGAYGVDHEVGAVYVYELNSDEQFEEVQIISGPESTDFVQFGWSVALGENQLAVASPHAYGLDAGDVKVYEKDDEGMWMMTETLQGDDTVGEDFFGWNVSMNENQIIVGATWEDHDENGENEVDRAGSAYIFEDLSSVGIKDATSVSDMLVYPVPASDFVTVSNEKVGITSVTVMNVSGKVVQQELNIGAKSYRLDISNLPEGLYLMQVTGQNGSVVSKKIVKANS